MLTELLVWETAIVVLGTYGALTFIKSALSLYAPRFRERAAVKKLGLPLLSALTGAVIAQAVHPPIVADVGAVTVYGLVCGYFATALFRHITSLVPALKTFDERLSKRPRLSFSGNSDNVFSSPTIPAPPHTVDSEVSRAEEQLP